MVSLASALLHSVALYYGAADLYLVLPEDACGLNRGAGLVQLWTALHHMGLSVAVMSVSTFLHEAACTHRRPLVVSMGLSVLEVASSEGSELDSRAVWLVLLADGDEDEDGLPRGLHVALDTEMLVAAPDAGGGYVLTSVYSVLRGQAVVREHFGRWDRHRGLSVREPNPYLRRRDLQGVIVPAVITQDPPFERVTESVGGSVVAEGFFSEVWRHMERRLNFTTRVRLVRGMTAGYVLANGTWLGMVGMLSHEGALVAYNRVTMTPPRAAVVHFTDVVTLSRACVFVRTPRDSGPPWKGYTRPFASDLWLTLAGMMTLQVMAVAGVSRWGVCDAFLFVWGASCGQGGNMPRTGTPGRMIRHVFHVCAFTVLTAYSATLVAHLAVRITGTLPFTSLQGLLEHGAYQLGVAAGSGVFTDFQSAKDPVVQQVYRRLLLPQLHSLPAGRLEGLQAACRHEHYAFFTTQDFVNGLRPQLECDLTRLPDSCFPIGMGLALSPKSGLRRAVNFQLHEMRRSGVLQALSRRMWPHTHTHLHTQERARSVTFLQVTPCLYLLVAAHVLAAALLAVEHLVFAKYGPREPPPPKQATFQMIA